MIETRILCCFGSPLLAKCLGPSCQVRAVGPGLRSNTGREHTWGLGRAGVPQRDGLPPACEVSFVALRQKERLSSRCVFSCIESLLYFSMGGVNTLAHAPLSLAACSGEGGLQRRMVRRGCLTVVVLSAERAGTVGHLRRGPVFVAQLRAVAQPCETNFCTSGRMRQVFRRVL